MASPFIFLGKIRIGAPQLPDEGNLMIVEVGNEEQRRIMKHKMVN